MPFLVFDSSDDEEQPEMKWVKDWMTKDLFHISLLEHLSSVSEDLAVNIT